MKKDLGEQTIEKLEELNRLIEINMVGKNSQLHLALETEVYNKLKKEAENMININTSGTSGANMVKRTIVNDDVMYVRYKESGLRQEYYFNRKGCDNEERGHFAIENGKVVCDRPAHALEVVLSGNSHFLHVSGSLVMSLN